MPHIYLDHNSTTPLHADVARAMAACQESGFGNPASQHWAGRAARKLLEEARHGMARILGADVDRSRGDELILTSGGTEANNLAMFGLAGSPPGRIVVSSIEHPSVLEAAEALARQGFDVRRLGVDGNGVVRVDQLAELLTPETRLVSVMLANHETGVLQPIDEIARICHGAGVPLHTDAVQVAGKLPIDFRGLGVSALTITAHKFHGPRGIGGLLLREGVQLTPMFYGGFQQGGSRPGTECTSLAVGMYHALQCWRREATSRTQRMAQLRNELESKLSGGFPGLVIHGIAAPRLPHTSNVAFPGLDQQALMMALDMAGVACSTGSACASGSAEPSPVLLAMGCHPALVSGSLRFSLSAFTTAEEMSLACSRILQISNDLRPVKRT